MPPLSRLRRQLAPAGLALLLAALACQAPAASTPPAPSRPPADFTLTPALAAPPSLSPTPPWEPEPGPGLPDGLRLVGYYAAWNPGTRGYPVSAIPAARLTHLNYAFAVLSEDGKCTLGQPADDEVNLAALQALKSRFPHLRTLLSLGGGGQAQGFSPAAATPEGRQRLAASCLEMLRQYQFDGLDVDWEYPQPEERANFTALLAELRLQLDRLGPTPSGGRYLLTIAAGASPYQYEDIDLDQIAPSLDWFNLMTYDYHGKWSALTGFNAPLSPSPGDQAASRVERETFNVQSAVRAFLESGVPPEKIVVGLPLYGRGWGGVGDVGRGLYQPFDPQNEFTRSYDYRELASTFLAPGSGYLRYWDAAAQVPWLFNPATGVMVSYDDPQSLGLKAGFIREQRLGGAVLWQVGMDDASASLLDSIYSRLVR